MFTERLAQTLEMLVDRERPIIVGLSGGADSMALLSGLTELGYECIASHCNFHLRGDESLRDEEEARKLAQRLGVRFVKKDFEVEAWRKATGDSTEMACRRLRYDWWNRLSEELDAQGIAVGHHLEDNVETFFLNLLRGSGIKGLKGMLPRSGKIIRPFLGFTRGEIEEYCRERGLHYVVDSTNLENEFCRNRLRNVVLTEFERQFPGAMKSIARSIENLRGNFELYGDAVARAREHYSIADGGILLTDILTCERHPRIVLYELLSDYGLNMTQTDDIIASARESGRKFSGSSGTTLLLDRGILRPVETEIKNPEEEKVDLFTNPHFTARLSPRNEFHPSGDSSVIYLDASVMEDNPVFAVKSWRNGDRIAPFGMKGTRKLSDIFSDLKIPVDRKSKIKVLTRNGEILWIIGIRASRHFPVTDTTVDFLTLRSV